MMCDPLLSDLGMLHNDLAATVLRAGDPDYRRQYHPDLSPLGWHLGHCLYTELYWVEEMLLADRPVSTRLKSLYVPELSPKTERGAALPALQRLKNWAMDIRSELQPRLQRLLNDRFSHPLLEDKFLLHFLAQHYAQHLETSQYILVQRNLRAAPAHGVTRPLRPGPAARAFIAVAAGTYTIGSAHSSHPYDNEHPAFDNQMAAFSIARRPASNAEYLGFMEDGGYNNRAWWTTAGWRWRQTERITHPDNWRYCNVTGSWFGIDSAGTHDLDPGTAVCGLSWYEAAAYAAWAGGRLPHEYEWESAARLGLLRGTGQVWEWCANSLHPYQGFTAFPYAGYSIPYFDGKHRVLRGGSGYTHRSIAQRPTFRNFYQAEKRHICAGVRIIEL